MSKQDATRQVIASRLRLAREMAGLSQAQVAKKLNLHRPSVTEMEAGRRAVSAEELTQLAKLYAVSVAWLTSGTAAKVDLKREKLELAARELAKLKAKDVDRLMQLLSTLREQE